MDVRMLETIIADAVRNEKQSFEVLIDFNGELFKLSRVDTDFEFHVELVAEIPENWTSSEAWDSSEDDDEENKEDDPE